MSDHLLTHGTFFLPGPTEVRPAVLQAMTGPMLPHRGAEFERLHQAVDEGLRPVFRTTQPVLLATCSATGLMEAAVRALPEGPVLSVVHGAFSERFARIAEACGREVHVLSVPLGEAPDPDAVHERLRARRFGGVTLVHSETSTAVTSDVRTINALARDAGATLVVDSVTGIAGMPLEADAWDVPFVLTGSQKALALPPGLAFGVAQPAFLEAAKRAPARGRYLDVVEMAAYAAKHQTPNTPAVSLLYAAAEQVRAIASEGVEARWARHAAMAATMHARVGRWAATLHPAVRVLAPPHARAATVTAVMLPPGVTGPQVQQAVARRGFVIGDGYGPLKQTTFRVGHMGDHTVEGLERCLDAVEEALEELLPRA